MHDEGGNTFASKTKQSLKSQDLTSNNSSNSINPAILINPMDSSDDEDENLWSYNARK